MEKTSRATNFYDFHTTRKTPDLAVRSCGNFTLVPPDREMARQVNFGEIFWPVAGQCVFRFRGKETILHPGKLWYYPPGSMQDFFPVEPFHYCWLTVSGKYSGAFFQMLGILPGINPTGLCPENLFDLLGREIDGHPRKQQRLEALNIAFRILTMSMAPPQSKPQGKKRLEEIKKRIDAGFMNPQLSIKHLAEEYGIHRVSLSRAFHRTYGQCISEYLISLRLKHAVDLLPECNIPVHEIASASGFHSVSYFDRVFTKKYGIAPSVFRMEKNVK